MDKDTKFILFFSIVGAVVVLVVLHLLDVDLATTTVGGLNIVS